MDASKLDAFNIQIMDVNKYIKEHNLQEVTSTFIHSSSSNELEPDGLFSERIFGKIASQDRLVRMGYIDLHCHVFHPVIFQNIMSIRRFYVEIMSGRSYAKWDLENRDFVRSTEDDPDAHTGFSFFVKYFPQINLAKNNSLKRNDKINVINKYKDRMMIDKCIVSPAAIRDINETDGGRVEKDSVNTLYVSLLERAKAMPKGADTDPIFDTVHYSIQRKVLEVYEYLLGFIQGKRGFLEAKFGARSIAKGTRNVITATSLECESPDSPQYHKQDEVKVPLYQAAKGFDSLVMYHIKTTFYGLVIHDGADSIALINPDTFALEYVQIDDKDRDLLLTSEGIMKTIDRFRDPEFRWKPVGATAMGKKYYLYLVHDKNNEITVFRNLSEFKMLYKNRTGAEPDMKDIRPLTYAEMLYVATYNASYGKSGTITRYPVTDDQSIFPARTHLMSTVPGRIVKFCTDVTTGASIEFPEYPVFGKNFVDALMFHPSKRAGLGADYDGDTISWIPLLSDEANAECENYYRSPSNYVFADSSPMCGTDDLVDVCLFALTEEPKKK